MIFWRLVLGHFIADFTLQTNKVAQWKRISRWGMVLHVVCHPIMYILFSWNYLLTVWVHFHGVALNGWTCVVLIALLHWAEDEWRVRCIRRGTQDSTAFLLWDQAVHLAVLMAFAPTLYGTHPETWVLTAIFVVLLAHFTSVLIFFVENDLGHASTVLAQGKYGWMAERLVLAAFFLIPGYWFLMAIGWMGWLLFQRYRQRSERTWAHLTMATVAVLVVGIALRRLFLA